MFQMLPFHNENLRKAKRDLKDFDFKEESVARSGDSENSSVQVEKSSVYKVGTSSSSNEMDIYWTSFNDLLPEGKEIEDLTPEELKLLRNRQRFTPLRPSTYQGATGIGRGAITSNRGSML
jgi:hypothetical protein